MDGMRSLVTTIGICGAAALLAGCGGSGSSDNGPAPGTVAAPTLGAPDSGLVNGNVATARFSNPVKTAVGSDGTVYVADFDNNAIRAISPAGVVSTLTAQTNFQRPFGMTISSNGTLYVSTDDDDTGAHAATTGTVWSVNRSTGVATPIARDLGRPRGIAALPDGRLVLSDLTHSTVSILDPAKGTVTLLAGTADTAGFNNATGAAAKFDRPYGCGVLPDGSILVADQNNNQIRRITMAGVVTTFAGSTASGAANGTAAAASFNHPEDVAVRSNGTVYVDDHDNFIVRRIKSGQVTTILGNGTQGFVDAPGLMAEFNGMEGMSLTPNGKVLWIADGNNGDGTAFNHVRAFSVN